MWLGRIAFWLVWPISFMSLQFSWRTRVLLMCGPEIAVVKTWLGSGSWGLPGGGLHKHELPLAGAIREVGEEVGITLLPEQLRQLGTYKYRQVGLPFRCHLFVVQLDVKPTLTRQRIEISAAKWQSTAALTSPGVQLDVGEALRRVANES